ncbi:hypothetical protein B0H13DRAFT_2450823 [Mycena leptocephala]|nr:hypothetical protein B0H13DRAFT_2450823 [Mycena leptocephala]
MILFVAIPLAYAWFIYRLIVRLRRSPASGASRMNAQGSCSAEELENVSYRDIDMVKVVPPATHAGYAVVGGSGFLGTHVFKAGAPPTVVFHMAAIIRYWERASYCWDASYQVNVIGTKNVLTVAKELPSAMVIYTSSAETVSGCPKFLRVDWDTYPTSIRDDDHTPTYILKENCYPRSKRMAEQLVISASANEGLKTGILRPGHTIIGPNDRLYVWDVAAAHLLYEDALNRIPEEVSGQGFLITGRGPAWNTENVRAAVKHYATRELVFIKLPPLLMYLLAHVTELFLFLRYHFLLPFFLLFGVHPSLIPQWLGSAVFLQPALLDVQMIDLIIDDSRVRKLLGYQPQWDVAQAIRYSVDKIQSGNVAADHGLKSILRLP